MTNLSRGLFSKIQYMNIDIRIELRNIILSTKNLKETYNHTHTHSKYSLELIIDEILYFLKSGVSWRMLRSKINYKTLYWHYNRWGAFNVFQKLFNRIKSYFKSKFMKINKTFYIDSSIIYNKGGGNKIGRNKFYKNKRCTKISIATDSTGFPISVLFMKGNKHDNSVFTRHIEALEKFKNITVVADKAYSSKRNYQLLNSKAIKHTIPPRKNMKIYRTYAYQRDDYIKRIKIEHIFARLKIYKRINLRYDKLLRNYRGFVLLALSMIGINILQ